MRGEPQPPSVSRRAGVPGARILPLFGAGSATVYLALAVAGDLRARLAPYLLAHLLLVAAMLAAWRLVRADHRNLPTALAAALLFRLVATAGAPALSDDVYRYVWDGRVQLHGVHPYAHAPDDPALASLRDENWRFINHPELETIYPPLAEALFLGLAALGAGPSGFRLAMGLADFGVVLALYGLLRRAGLGRDRVMLYAWNPLAVMETAGSGHVEPVGVACLLLALWWAIDRRAWRSGAALAAAVQVKLLPIALAPGLVRRRGWAAALAGALTVGATWLPYAATGPPVGAGLFAYAGRWEHNALVYAGVESLLERVDSAGRLEPLVERLRREGHEWIAPQALYRYIWPRELARALVALAGLAWIALVVLRRDPDPLREALWILGGLLLLSPTVHPWYALWILPLAAARCSAGWLVLCAAVPLAYVGGAADVAWGVRVVEYLPALALLAASTLRARRASA